MRTRTPILAILAGFLLAAGPTLAQNLNLSGDDATPLEIDAIGGIEWQQDAQLFIARDTARAVRGDTMVEADELRAYYRTGANSNNEIWRIDANGNVRITSAGRVATSGHAVYDVVGKVIVLDQGDPVKLVADTDILTAESQLEFWDERKLAVARGNATVVHGTQRVRADVLTAHFDQGADGKTEITLVEAFDNVVIDTEVDHVTANRAAYDVRSGLARLTGSVKIKRGDNVIEGCSADINLNTGISKMISCGGTKGGRKRVRGVIMPGATAKP